MAGAGYKLFNTGDVLTAAQVNTYLQEQTVMVFANSTARTTALSGVLAEGMVTYLKDTDAVEKYNGSAWVSIGGSASPLTTKGDLYTYSTTDARLAVGNNGETLVADSSATTGLRWQADFAAGKNKIINGDFNINQRNFSSTTTYGTYGLDRWWLDATTGTTYSVQTFTPGTAPVSGYEGRNFARLVTASQSANGDYAAINQRIEDVRTLAGQTITVSLWAKASSGTPKIGIAIDQHFGAGGSSGIAVSGGIATISTSWTRYSFTFALPSLSGKTIGTGSYLNLYMFTSTGSTVQALGYPAVGLQNATIDFWGVQVEAGSVATAFQTATGTLAGELAACQRYYFRTSSPTTSTSFLGTGRAYNTTLAEMLVVPPVQMRIYPTSLDYANIAINYTTTNYTTGTWTLRNYASTNFLYVEYVHGSGIFTAGQMLFLATAVGFNGYVGFSSEL